jgi:hypothetical protein
MEPPTSWGIVHLSMRMFHLERLEVGHLLTSGLWGPVKEGAQP